MNIILMAIVFIVFFGCSFEKTKQKEIIIVFRYDDYSKYSAFEIEKKIVNIFKENNIKISIGVIPFLSKSPLNSENKEFVFLGIDKENYLKNEVKNNSIEVALHGCTHQLNNYDRKLGEFGGISLLEQTKKIYECVNYLKNVIEESIEIYIPPWNRYDQNTLYALEQLNFSIISADIDGDVNSLLKIRYIPATTNLKDIQKSIESARSSKEAQSLIVCLFHSYDFEEINEEKGIISIQEFHNLLKLINSQKDIKIVDLRQAAEIMKDLGANRYLINRTYYWYIDSLIPHFLRFLIPDYGTYLSDSNKFIIMYVLSFYYLVFIISFDLTLFIYNKYKANFKLEFLSGYFFTIILLSISIYALRDGVLGINGAIAITVLSGITAGIYLNKKFDGFVKSHAANARPSSAWA